jgi:hypothetical protein
MDRLRWAAAVVLGVTSSAGAADEPIVLSDLELDAVTAAGVLVDVGSFATALGDLMGTRTDADTFVFGGEGFDLGVGRTMGLVWACCTEETDVAVGSSAVGSGDIVHGTTHSVEHDGRFLSLGLSVGFVLVLSVEKHFGTARDEHVAMLEHWHAALADRHLELPDALMKGSQ